MTRNTLPTFRVSGCDEMEWCVNPEIKESWNCVKESNGEYLLPLLIAELVWWVLVLFGLRKLFWGFRRWRHRKYMEKMKKSEEESRNWRKEQLDTETDK